MLMICLYSLAFVISMGIYIGTLVRNSTTAVIANLVLALVLWLGLPLALLPIGHREVMFEYALWTNPVYQTGVATMGAARESRYQQFMSGSRRIYYDNPDQYRFGNRRTDTGGATAIIAISTAGFLGVSALLLWGASINLRRRE
jgi:hypothetical protein